MTLAILNIGPIELLIVVGAAVLLFGGDLPEVARKLARLVARLRALTSELAREFEDLPPEVKRPPRLDLPDTGIRRELEKAARLDEPPSPPDETDQPGGPDSGDQDTADEGDPTRVTPPS